MKQETEAQFFSVLQSDYSAWLSQVMLSALYDPVLSRKEIIPPPLLTATTDSGAQIPSRIQDTQSILHELARKILADTEKPSRDAMETFLVTFENFQTALQRLEHGLLMADLGIDELTGMQTQDKMIADLERELERRARRGQPFCFALSRIDGDMARKDTQNIVLAAKSIQKTIRSFDDAYVVGEGEFLSSLKHSDNNGGLKFVGRLNNILIRNPDIRFTMTSIVAEPLPGDNVKHLIDGVRADLDGLAATSKGASGQYEEVSPLTRYLQSIKESPGS